MKNTTILKKSSTQMGGGKLLLISILTPFFMFAQNQQNTLPTTGNVGVGTTTPDVKLQVNGRLRVDSSLLVKDSAVFEKRTHIKDRIIVDEDAVIKGKLVARDKLKVKGTAKFEGNVKLLNLNTVNSSDTTLLFINANGKVKSGGVSQLLTTLSQNPQSVGVLSNMIYGTLPPSQIACPPNHQPIWHNEPEVLWAGSQICPARVGIMMSNPQYELDVNGVSRTKDIIVRHNTENVFYSQEIGNIKFMVLDGTLSALAFKAPNTTSTNGNWAIEYNTFAGGLNFWKPWPNANGFGNYFLFLKDNGNVGIGTKDAKYKLSVEGTIGAREVIVNLDSWADYVFEENYDLPTLNETENYIKVNGHLPGVPSADCIEESGLNVGETAKITMQKVEELTLHLIQINKKVEKQGKTLQQQKDLIQAQQKTIALQQQLIEKLNQQVRQCTNH